LGDVRFQKPYDRLKDSTGRAEILRSMSSEDVIAALAAASREQDPLLANVLASEAQNRVSREEAALECLGEGVCIVDAQARVVHINRAGADLIHRPATEVLWHPAREVLNLIDPTLGEAGGLRPEDVVLATGRGIESEEGVLTPNGSDRKVLVGYSAAPVRREGEVTGVVIAFRDITQRRRAEQALAQSEARLRRLLQAIPDAILVIDPNGCVRYVNPAAEDLLGRGAQELLGASLGIPSVSVGGAEVDVSGAGGTWRLARQRTIPFEWENEPAFLSIYSQVREPKA